MMGKPSTGKQGASQSFYGSNASTGVYPVNDEQDRVNRIMQEPIENLITNMNNLSRPVSSKFNLNLQSNKMLFPKRYNRKKERAMTAGHKQGLPFVNRGPNTSVKIAESAYHINTKDNMMNHQQSGMFKYLGKNQSRLSA